MKHGMLPAFIILLVGLPMSEGGEGNVPTSRGDWPQWRGPLRDGVSTETGLLQEWDEEGPLRFRSPLTLERKACRKGCLQPEL